MKKLIPILLFLYSLNALSQVFSFRDFNEDAGLSQSFIYDIKQNKKGFLHIATGNGLSVFSGYTFENSTIENGLSENFVTTIYNDTKDRMWLGHFEGGVSLKDENGIIKKIPSNTDNNFKVIQITELDKGRFLFLKNNYGAELYDEHANKLTVPENSQISEVLKVLYHNGTVLFLKKDGLYTLPAAQLFKNKFLLEKKMSLDDAADMEFTPDKKRLILLENNMGVSILQNTNDYAKADFYPIKKSESTSYTKLFIDASNIIYVGTTDAGLIKIEPESGTITRFTKSNGLKSDAVQTLFVDREGNLWIGLYGKGLQQMRSELFNYNLILDENRQAVSINKLLKVNGKLYAATNSGIGIISGNNIQYLKSGALPATNFNNLTIFNNHLFFTTESGVLFQSDTLLRAVQKIDYGIKSEVILVNNLVATTDHLYICTSGGLSKIPAENSEITVFTTGTGLLHNNVKTVFLDSKKRLWICTPGSPLHYMEQTGEIKKIENLPSLKNFNVNSICEDSKNNYWISTIGDGVIRYNFHENKSYTVKEGLKSNYCYGVVIDRRNNVWVNHVNGISYKVASKTNFNHIDESPDLSAMNFVENSFYYEKTKGKLYFGASEGFVTINTRKQKFNEIPPTINILEVKANDKILNLKSDSLLNYDGYDITVSFVGICLTDPSKVKYRYKLEGYDKDWHTLSAETRKINYSQIKDGTYELKIMASNNDDLWNERAATFRFSVARPYWKQIWFYIAVAAIAALILFLSIKWYTRNLRARQKQLEKIISMKTKEITYEKTRIENLFRELKVKNTDLTDSINYAKRIQEALLPLESYIRESFNAACFYKAKDIVSGDFYWFRKTKNYSFAAAVDCTGHGVPGAFMSFIGATILDEIVTNNEDLNPVEILQLLDQRVINVLNQHSKEGDYNRDGMDLSICKYNSNTRILEVSGAGRPFYLYTDGAVQRYKSSRYSAGGAFKNIDKGFELLRHQTKPGDNLFLFSDGFTDQMGGAKNKKYSSKRLGRFIGEIAQLDPLTQKRRIEKEFNEWQRDEEQTDDVLLITIKF